jgi:DUF438 domain-containing protein
VGTGRAQDILIGPRTTVYALLQAYPFLERFLLARVDGFDRLTDERAATRWARVMTLNDIALKLDLPWRQMVRAIAVEVERETGRPPRAADAPRRIADDERRLGELRAIVAGLEEGRPLSEMADRWREATADLEQAETAALEAALSGEASADRDAGLLAATAAAREADESPAPEPGHPLESLRREAELVRQLCAGLQEELGRLGGSPTRRRWQRERPLVARLADRLSSVELRYRREQQAWLPALRVYGVDGPQELLVARQGETLETLRRLRLAVEHDDAARAVEAGARLIAEIDDLLALDHRLLEPLARRHFSAGDWAAVRELEDGVGWALIAPPPPWPRG